MEISQPRMPITSLRGLRKTHQCQNNSRSIFSFFLTDIFSLGVCVLQAAHFCQCFRAQRQAQDWFPMRDTRCTATDFIVSLQLRLSLSGDAHSALGTCLGPHRWWKWAAVTVEHCEHLQCSQRLWTPGPYKCTEPRPPTRWLPLQSHLLPTN